MKTLLDVSPVGHAYICLGGFVVMFSVFSLFIKQKVYANETIVGTLFGILMGPLGAGVFDPRSWAVETNKVTLEVTRVVLATGLFLIGVELPKSYMINHMKGLFAMVVPTMAIGWFIVASLLKILFQQFDFVTCLALAACLTPTDPVISAAIVGGDFAKKYVPVDLRDLLAAESAANDGLAYPFLSISIYLTLEKNRLKDIKDWILVGWLYQVILGTLIGAVIGYLFSFILRLSYKKGFADRDSYSAQYLALSILVMGVVHTLGSDDLLAAFAAGCTISWDDDFKHRTEGQSFAFIIEYILNCGCFFYIGAWLPWKDFTMPELGISPGRLFVLCIGILVLRRIPAILALYKWVPEIKNWKEALFCGHFGPMGVGAVFTSTYTLDHLPRPRGPPETQQEILATVLHPIVGFVVLVSIIVHGLSIPLFNAGRKLHKRTSKHKSKAQLPFYEAGTPEGSTPQLPPLAVTREGKGLNVDASMSDCVELPVIPAHVGPPPKTKSRSQEGTQAPSTANEHEHDDVAMVAPTATNVPFGSKADGEDDAHKTSHVQEFIDSPGESSTAVQQSVVHPVKAQ